MAARPSSVTSAASPAGAGEAIIDRYGNWKYPAGAPAFNPAT